jgi:hypothetical protein
VDENRSENVTTSEAHSLLQNKYYAGYYLNLYGAEDFLDQLLCIAANKQGYDVVILENMIGSHQVITEVLDTRERRESFKSLIYIIS